MEQDAAAVVVVAVVVGDVADKYRRHPAVGRVTKRGNTSTKRKRVCDFEFGIRRAE